MRSRLQTVVLLLRMVQVHMMQVVQVALVYVVYQLHLQLHLNVTLTSHLLPSALLYMWQQRQ